MALDATTDNAYVFASAAEIRLTGVKPGARLGKAEFKDILGNGAWAEPVRQAVEKPVLNEMAAKLSVMGRLCSRAQAVGPLYMVLTK